MLLTMLFTMNTRTCMHNAHINAHIYKHANVENIYTDVYTNTQASPMVPSSLNIQRVKTESLYFFVFFGLVSYTFPPLRS